MVLMDIRLITKSLLFTADKAIDLAAARQVGGSVRQEKESARNFYDQFGWKPTASAKYGDTALFIDQRALSYGFTTSSMRRWMEPPAARGA